MRTNIIFFLFIFIFSGCVTFFTGNYPEDFSVKYRFQGHLTGYEQYIELNQYTLKFSFKKPGVEKKYSSINIHDDPALTDIYNYINDADLINQQQTGSEALTDAPEESIMITCDENTKTINLGITTSKPEKFAKLKIMLFDLVTNYYHDWKLEAGIE